MTTTGFLLGALLGGAVCLFVYAVVPPRPQLRAVVTRWERQRSVHPSTSTQAPDWQSRYGGQVAAALAQRGLTLTKLRADLELTDGSLEALLVKKIGYGLIGLLLPSVVSILLAVTGDGGRPSLGMPMGFGLILAVVFFMLPDATVHQEAAKRRDLLRMRLSSYLDLVSMSLAGGRGLPEALPACARIGSDWAFELIQDTISEARYTGATPERALEQLGERTQLQELQDLGGALALVAEDGAKVRDTLSTRAASARKRLLAEAEGAAAKADQSMQMAQIVLAVGFFIFLGFPGLMTVLAV